jgi:hypothetical protein
MLATFTTLAYAFCAAIISLSAGPADLVAVGYLSSDSLTRAMSPSLYPSATTWLRAATSCHKNARFWLQRGNRFNWGEAMVAGTGACASGRLVGFPSV